MAAAVVNIALEQGVTWRRHITWRTPPVAPATVGELRDLTGATADMQIRSQVGGRLFAEITETSGITLGGLAGTIDLELSATLTSAVTQASAVYDLVISFPDGDVVRLLEGKVACDLGVTVPVV